ncbi:solute carrier family 22 member 6-like [Pyrgilauda ruficollis]|uniref:solute carrier family 22 member 6-like n=1 Tax=Pyrgilauda ruficollis TaxID=221976 RepID=UPI001B85B3F3|nr:solute carrier family 22 member 6-like [Pyrgilauda ruficollis]
MSFVELLSRLGGMGRFQVTYVAALAVPLLMLASHNLLQNFTAGIPEHHCRPRPVANATAADVPLVVSIPWDSHRRPQSCRRYVEPQWHLLDTNGSANGTATEAATEPCHDGWMYLDGIFTDTIVTEWDLVCDSKKMRQVAQSIYMAGILLGSSLFGILSDNPPGALPGADPADPGALPPQALRALVRREPPLPGGAVAALVRTPGMRTVSCGVSFVWFSTSFAYYGLAMDLQGFGFNVYLSQLVFGAVDIPAKLLSVLVISCLGRRLAQGGSLALAGLCILANIFVPSGGG